VSVFSVGDWSAFDCKAVLYASLLSNEKKTITKLINAL